MLSLTRCGRVAQAGPRGSGAGDSASAREYLTGKIGVDTVRVRALKGWAMRFLIGFMFGVGLGIAIAAAAAGESGQTLKQQWQRTTARQNDEA